MAMVTRAGAVAPVVDGAWLGRGAIAGILGGIAMMVFELVVAASTMGLAWVQLPVRMAAGILLGPGALEARTPIIPVAIAGALVHLALSAGFGVFFASLVDPRTRSTWLLTVMSALYGGALWSVNFYVLAPMAGWDWFPQLTNPAIQLVAHAIIYAPVTALALPRQRAARVMARKTRERRALRRAA